MEHAELKDFLDELELRYNRASFVDSDPISIPYLFDKQSDIEIAAFLTATIAWGQRPMILRNARRMVERLDMSPTAFINGATQAEIQCAASGFVHRTFNDEDFATFLSNLQRLLRKWGSLGHFFEHNYSQSGDLRRVLADFRAEFLGENPSPRTARHISSIEKGSACKRLCMMLRWMVRCDDRGVDFGLWRSIPPSALYIPLDVHSARQGRQIGLLTRSSDDWRAVEELTDRLRLFDAQDPVKYDFALFGVGVFDGQIITGEKSENS